MKIYAYEVRSDEMDYFKEYEKKYDINGYQPEAEADKKFSAKAKDSEKDKDNEKSSGKKKDKDKKKDKKK